jgi:hypothetical protein
MTATQTATPSKTMTWQVDPAHSLDDFSDVIWINSHNGQRQYPF